MSEKIRVLLYYKYVSIENAEEYAAKHLEFCKSIGLKGRILIADEGINGTVSGDYETTQKYMDWVHSDERFADLWFKIDEENQQAFRKMFVRYKKEIVHLGLEDNNFDSDINPLETTGEYLNPKQFKEALLDEDTVVLDTRNDYEYDLGHFRGAIRPDIRNFRELPQWVRDNKDKFMEKRVVVYCTGGVRCEKFSGWMVREGFKDVGQLHGGIATYGKDPEVQGELWDGAMYVFDDRISVPINHVNPTVISKDYFDGTPCERYVNCANPFCNKQIFASEENEAKYVRGGARLNVVHMNVIAMCKKMVYHVKNGNLRLRCTSQPYLLLDFLRNKIWYNSSMNYEASKQLTDVRFKRLVSVQRTTFEEMLAVLKTAYQRKHAKGGRTPKLSLEDLLMATLQYMREYRTYEQIAADFGIHESNLIRRSQWVESTLIQSGFTISKTHLSAEDTVIVDATEVKINRPKKIN